MVILLKVKIIKSNFTSEHDFLNMHACAANAIKHCYARQHFAYKLNNYILYPNSLLIPILQVV